MERALAVHGSLQNLTKQSKGWAQRCSRRERTLAQLRDRTSLMMTVSRVWSKSATKDSELPPSGRGDGREQQVDSSDLKLNVMVSHPVDT